ncbi:self-incompatibility protein 1 [Cucumis melo var. makuwa]|uniref:S-protein homolog n=1 Tax=Cucumis melo var. makuwa TaxID=1194695 RepID=A0A5A7TT98_CUCMM|nr:self-incompatibility protein 1 [Cucumis melo var. makuwa]
MSGTRNEERGSVGGGGDKRGGRERLKGMSNHELNVGLCVELGFGNMAFNLLSSGEVPIGCPGSTSPSGRNELISLLPETTVTIVNEVGGPLLGIHCRSKQDDLGVNVVSSDKSYSFNFRPNIWGTTLFYCVFEWVKGQPHYFTIYDFKRDGKTCTNCRWLVYASGPCLQHSETSITCFPWNKNAPELKY